MLARASSLDDLSFFSEVGLILVHFLQGQLLISLCNALVAWLAFWALGIHPAWLLGAVVGLMSFIPYLGPVLGFLPALVMAWISRHTLWHVAAVIGVWGLVQLLEGLVFQPKILGDKLKIHPLLVVLSFFIWGALLNVAGVILAVPLTALAQVIYRRIKRRLRP
ncbi:AI-2E family transporter [candidate division FCPU426 bacterium]|nr:AI-2E family transporter [candidate division FCPU426 bacterium]